MSGKTVLPPEQAASVSPASPLASPCIRDVRPADENTFCRFVERFYSSSAVCHPIPASHAKRTFAALMEGSPFIRALLLEQEGQPIGYALLALTWSNEAGGLNIWIEELMIEDAYQGEGHGTQLLRYIKNAYPDARRFRLEITPENTRARALYQSLGFVTLPYRQMIFDRPK